MSDEVRNETVEPVMPSDATMEEPETPATEVRPWHGTDNPLEAMYQWVSAELAKLRGGDGSGGGAT